MSIKTVPIFLAFLLMGVADAMGPLSDAVKNQYQLNHVMATMLSFFCLHRLCGVQRAGRFAGGAFGLVPPPDTRINN